MILPHPSSLAGRESRSQPDPHGTGIAVRPSVVRYGRHLYSSILGSVSARACPAVEALPPSFLRRDDLAQGLQHSDGTQQIGAGPHGEACLGRQDDIAEVEAWVIFLLYAVEERPAHDGHLHRILGYIWVA